MKAAVLITLVSIAVLLGIGGTALAQDVPEPSVTLEVQAITECVINLYVNDICSGVINANPQDANAVFCGPLLGYDLQLSYPTDITVNAAPINTWYNHATATGLFQTCADGKCRFAYFNLPVGVSGSGPLQELTLTGSTQGQLAFLEITKLTGISGAPIVHTDGVAIDVETCQPTAISGPLQWAGESADGRLGFLALVGVLALLALSLTSFRRGRQGQAEQ